MAAAGIRAILALVLVNAFFVLGEFSLISVDREKVGALRGAVDSRADRLLAATRDLTRQLSGAQFGITLSSMLLGFVAEPLVAHAAAFVPGPASTARR